MARSPLRLWGSHVGSIMTTIAIAEKRLEVRSPFGWRHQVRFASGVPSTFSKIPGVERSFCADRGTSSDADDGPNDEIWLTIGFMDNPERFEPRAHGYWCMKLPWFQLSDTLPRYDAYTRRRDKAVAIQGTGRSTNSGQLEAFSRGC